MPNRDKLAGPMVRRLAAGAKGIRTAGPTVNGTECGARRLSAGEPASEGWDLEFESGLLQRRVCEPSVPQRQSGAGACKAHPKYLIRWFADLGTGRLRRHVNLGFHRFLYSWANLRCLIPADFRGRTSEHRLDAFEPPAAFFRQGAAR